MEHPVDSKLIILLLLSIHPNLLLLLFAQLPGNIIKVLTMISPFRNREFPRDRDILVEEKDRTFKKTIHSVKSREKSIALSRIINNFKLVNI